MSSNFFNATPYLKTTQDFPRDNRDLSTILTKTYIETAQAINTRTIGHFPTNKPAITGERYFFSSQPNQVIRRVYEFDAAGNIAHGIPDGDILQFVKGYGSYTDGTNWYGVLFGTSVSIAGLCSFYITDTNIVVDLGAGAPAISSGTIVIEWLSKA